MKGNVTYGLEQLLKLILFCHRKAAVSMPFALNIKQKAYH